GALDYAHLRCTALSQRSSWLTIEAVILCRGTCDDKGFLYRRRDSRPPAHSSWHRSKSSVPACGSSAAIDRDRQTPAVPAFGLRGVGQASPPCSHPVRSPA